MKKTIKKVNKEPKYILHLIVLLSFVFGACESQVSKEKQVQNHKEATTNSLDTRKSLHLNEMQKNHQLINMRSHLEAVQSIVLLLAEDKYEEASKTAREKLGSTTEMRMMCASFGDKNFEKLGLEFHKRADEMSTVFKTKDKDKSLSALANTMKMCIRCHATYKQ